MANTIWVKANRTDRKVILSEYDELHPTENHEVYIVGYEDPRTNADGVQIEANPPLEVGDTPGVRQAIAAKDLVIVSAPMARQTAERERQAAERERQAAERAEAKRIADEQAAADKAAAEAAAKGAK